METEVNGVKTKTINTVKVKPIPINKRNDLPVKGKELFGTINSTALLCAKRNSGKTTLLYHIIKSIANKETTIIFFVSTIFSDDSYDVILDYCDKKKIPYEIFTEIKEGRQDHLAEVIQKMKEAKELMKKEEEESSSSEEEILAFEDKNYRKVKPKKKKVQTPKFICILDDIGSTELKSQSVINLFKHGRHYLCFTFVSTQYCLDVLPVQHQNCNFYLLFGGINEEKLKKTYDSMPLTISYPMLSELYHDATAEHHNFLYINVTTGEIRRNFNERYLI
jgi:hypothetical protein